MMYEPLDAAMERLLRHADSIKRITFDVGDRMVKVAYLSTSIVSPIEKASTTENDDVPNEKEVNRLHCFQMEKADVVLFHNYLKMKTDLKSELEHVDAVSSYVTGTIFLLKNIESEAFTYNHSGTPKYEFVDTSSTSIFPFLMINVGTGVSVIEVESETSFKRIGGSSIGGGTFVGLGNLLTGDKNVEELLKNAEKGDNSVLDRLVSSYNLGPLVDMAASTIASSFANAGLERHDLENLTPQDSLKSLLYMIINNIGQMAYLYSQKSKIDRVYFNGFF
ncbi:unnamed protein product [Caenorhabditis auriculariae]|uniref:Pantothenate kinase n=1 Tax=Caenorhabditis auriculariae TaxID=2777116 RepID=A0A8S1GVF6_9PELO|nr:unnamed protein product [Caenorhabditis auriculariae]